MAQRTETDWEQRALRAEAALQDALEERNRLWEELHRHKAREREVEHLTGKVVRMESSLSWKITRPIRTFKRLVLRARNADKARLREKLGQINRDD